MRWSTYVSPSDGAERVGVVRDGVVHALRGNDHLIDLLSDPAVLADAGTAALADPAETVAEADAVPCAPIPVPPSIRDFMAFEEHLISSMHAIGREVDPAWYEIPVFYFTNPAAVRGPKDPVNIAPGSTQFDYELEVAAVIGRAGSDIPVERAADHIAGYTVLCDWSARDHQALEMRVGLGPVKGKDTATSLGPWLVTPDELAPHAKGKGFDLEMTATVNGEQYSTGNWSAIHWSFAQMICFASRGTEVRTGDIIGSGTVGTGCILELARVHGAERYPWLQADDQVRLEIEGLGHIETTLKPGAAVNPLQPAIPYQ
jgi:2-keto-4-pentenoate hydratase/2-oxohepta-3-ene-1,7-dioic acid hydratase in catechol pathway